MQLSTTLRPVLLGLLGLLLTARHLFAQTFSPAVNYPAGSIYPIAIATGDLNGDGQFDLATANATSNAAAVLLGRGNGTFQSPATYSTGPNSYPNYVAIGDVNGDGKNDLVSSNNYSAGLAVLLGNGNGTFQAPTIYYTGARVVGVVLRDLNADNKLDLITSNTSNSAVGILLGNGNGTFQPVKAFSTGLNTFPTTPAVGDMNGDGKPDIVTPNNYNGTVGLLLGNGDGTFQPVVTLALGSTSQPTAVALGDTNSDGKLDIVTSNYGTNTVGVLLGAGNGSFQALATYSTGAGSTPTDVLLADLNGDGHLDIATATKGLDAVSVLPGNGMGQFGVPSTYPMGADSEPSGIAVGDANNDGRLDLFSANYATTSSGVLLNTTAPTLLSFTPLSGLIGATITLTGTGLANATAVNFNGTPASFTVNSATSISTVVPAGATTGLLTVVTPGGSATSTTPFTVVIPNPAPSSTTLSPTTTVAGSADLPLTVSGAGFISTSVVSFNGVALATTYVSATQLTVVVPAANLTTPGSYPVVVSSPAPGGGTSIALAFVVTVPAPTIVSFTPTSGGAGTTITLTGTNLTGATEVRIGSVLATFTVVSATSLTLVAPATTSGVSGFITVTTPGGAVTSTTAYTYTGALATATSTTLPKLQVYPNPFYATLTVTLPSISPAQTALYDAAGRLVLPRAPLPTTQQLSLPANLTAGVYFLKIWQDGTTTTRRVIKH
jgi:hypothetical protein